MSRISVMLGCCLNDDEMAELIKEHPEYFEDKSPKNSDCFEMEEMEDVVTTQECI